MIPSLESCLYQLLTLRLVPLSHLTPLDAYLKSVTTIYYLPDHSPLMTPPLYSGPILLPSQGLPFPVYSFPSIISVSLCLSSFSLVKQLLIYLILKRGGGEVITSDQHLKANG